MISTEQKVSWIDEAFEQNKTGKSLSTLKKEFDTIISKNSKSKNEMRNSQERQPNSINSVLKQKQRKSETNVYSFVQNSNNLRRKSYTKPGTLNKAKSISRFFYHSTSNVSNKKILKSGDPTIRRKHSTKSNSTVRNNDIRKPSCSITSQFPKPVECIKVEIEDHYFVPPVVINGELVTNFQYFTLHDNDKDFCDNCNHKQTKKLNFVRQTSQDLTHKISKILNKDHISPASKNNEHLSLNELYDVTFNVESVKDLYNKNEH